MIDIEQILSNTDRPELFSPSSSNMWNDEHIAQQMLKAHLDPNFEGASRNHDFIKKSVNWIDSQISPNSSILDLGCGPGLYCQPLSLKGHSVTGVDFSENSIEYAKENAKKEGLDINYLYQNYLDVEFDERFDLVVLIFCDFGVLSIDDQQVLLNKINSILNEKGKLIFDVFSQNHFLNYHESNSWNAHHAGFWRAHQHLVLEKKFKYPSDLVTLEQYQIVDAQGIETYRNWNKCFSKSDVLQLLDLHGFGNTKVYADITGRAYESNTDTLGIVTEKIKNLP